MKSIEYVFLGLIIFIFIIFNAYSYTASYSGDTPSNGSQSPFNLSIEVDIGGSEDVSSFLLWDNSLLGYWNFENGDSTHVFDYSEFKRNGSYVNGAYITTGGIRGNRSFFDGTNDRIQIPASTSINRVFENGGTISFWAYADNYGSTDLSYLISNYDSLQHTFIIWIKNWVGTQPNAIQLTAGYETSNAYWIAHDSFYTGTWNHVVVRYN